VLRGLSHDIPATLIIALHLANKDFPGLKSFKLEDWFRQFTRIPIMPIQSGTRLQRGIVYVTPPGQSLLLEGRTLQLEPQHDDRPLTTVNILFESAAKEFGDQVIGVILTGLLIPASAYGEQSPFREETRSVSFVIYTNILSLLHARI
jgi:chemotaxis response regulator CheB